MPWPVNWWAPVVDDGVRALVATPIGAVGAYMPSSNALPPVGAMPIATVVV